MERELEMLVELSQLMVGVAYASLHGRLELRQFRALAFVGQQGTCTVGELATASGLPSSSTTRLCDQLVERGWLRRTAADEDRRQVALRLTEAGAASVAEVRQARAAQLRAARRRLSARQREALTEALPALVEALSHEEAGTAWAL